MPGYSGWRGLTAPLAVRDYRLVWAAEAQSLVGDQLAKVATAVLVYQRTGSAALSALVFAATTLPAAAGAGIAWLADRYPRRAVLVSCAAAQAVLVAVMAVPGVPWAALVLLLAAVQLVQSPFLAAQNALVAEVLPVDLLAAGTTLRQTNLTAGGLFGLAAGGLLVTGVGPFWALALDAATFAVSALLLTALRPRPAPLAPVRSGPRWRAGFTAVFGHPGRRALVLLVWLTAVPYAATGLVVGYAAQVGAPGAVGWLLAAGPAGWLLVTALRPTGRDRERWLGALAVAVVLPLVGFAVAPPAGLPAVLVAVGLLALSGAAELGTPTAISAFTALTPDHLRGAAHGVARSGLRVAMGLAAAGGGLLAQLVRSAHAAIAAVGVLGLLLAVPAALAWQRSRTTVAEVTVS
jgi:MFS family permease